MSGYSEGLSAFKLAFELSPILLTGGLFKSFPGAIFPLMGITQALNFPMSVLSGADATSLDRFFAHFQVLPGSTLVQQEIGKYPFANATIAANAVITQPLTVSMLMICPIQNQLGWAAKLATITAMKKLIDLHNSQGGTYTVLTPAYPYTQCVMRGFHDASSQMTKQLQNTYQLDFEAPLLTLSDAQTVLNSVFDMIKNATGDVTDILGLGVSNQPSAILPALMPSGGMISGQLGGTAP
jgi:hypothetical protein